MYLGDIEGLRFESNLIDTCHEGTSCITFDGARPLNVVFHGHTDEFSYEYYGIHQGTEDRLTFVGRAQQKFRAEFIDCRENSKTWGKRACLEITPSIQRCLVIPPGVAHIFDGLERVYTINSFKNFLPPPDDWLSGLVEWNIAADTINIHRNIADDEIPRIRTNAHAASRTFYELTSRNIEKSMDGVVIEYPFTHSVKFSDGSEELLKFQKKTDDVKPKPRRLELDELIGVHLNRRLFVTGSDGDEAGFTTMTCGLLSIFDHHVENIVELANKNPNSVRHLTFFDDPQSTLVATATRGNLSSTFSINPSCFYDLVLQPGVTLELSGQVTLSAIRMIDA
ncbi:hypothetical protein [Aliiroseovarius sp.]|uniref:hypothetical protein n=1 Tax=Aliiroseovarius sp. TaxID=1872442 RepID=UPI003BAC9018